MATVDPKTASAQLEDLRKALLEVQDQNKELVSVIACLVEEKEKIEKALYSERTMRKNLQKDQKHKEREKDEEIRLLKERVTKEKHHTESVKKRWTSEFKRFYAAITEEDKRRRQAWQDEINLIQLKNKALMMENRDLKELNGGLIVKQQQEFHEVRNAQHALDKDLSGVFVEKDDLINRLLTEKKALQTETLECVAKLQKKENEIIQSEAEWQTKLAALEDQVRCKMAATEEISERAQELERKAREMEDEWRIKVAQKEEEIKILTQNNTELQVLQISLQELAQKTDKEKAKLKRQEKKEKEEELKRQKKEKEEMEKRDKKERKEEAEREKKVKKENEKREKEELKRLKKEEEEKSRRGGRGERTDFLSFLLPPSCLHS